MPRHFATGAFDLRAERQARKVSQQFVAALLHTTQPSISRWESDGSMPNIFRMAWSLHWQLEDLKHAADTSTNTRAGKTGRNKRAGSLNARATSRKRGSVHSAVEEGTHADAESVSSDSGR